MASKYRELTEKDTHILATESYITLDKEKLSILTERKIKQVKKRGRKLNKKCNANFISDIKKDKMIKLASLNGFYSLQGFAEVYRKEIKISHPTLYRRIYANKHIKDCLVRSNFIEFYSKNNTDKNVKNPVRIKVFANKVDEFIDFINHYFLVECQQKEII